MTLKGLKKGDYFTLKPIEYPTDKQVYIRGDYDRTTRTYSCIHYNDINNEVFRKGTTTVYTEFIF